MQESLTYKDYCKKYYTVTVELKLQNNTKLAIAIPLRPNKPYFVFPNNDIEIKRMIYQRSLIYFYRCYGNCIFDCVFNSVDSDSIVFAKELLEKHGDEVEAFMMSPVMTEAITKAHNCILSKSANKILNSYFTKYKEVENNE